MFQQTVGLDMARGRLETGGAFVEVTVDIDVAKFPALKAGLVVAGVVTDEGSIVITASPPNFSAGDHGFFFLSQG